MAVGEQQKGVEVKQEVQASGSSPPVEIKKRAAIAAQNVAVTSDVHIPSIPKDIATLQMLGVDLLYAELPSLKSLSKVVQGTDSATILSQTCCIDILILDAVLHVATMEPT